MTDKANGGSIAERNARVQEDFGVDMFDVLDCALRTRFLEVDELPAAPIWGRLPAELAAVLALADEPLGGVLRLMWQVRKQLLGKPVTSDARTKATVALRLGLLFLRHQEGRLEAGELLTRAFHVADSYVCEVDPRPFLRLLRELEASGPEGNRVAVLFAPYAAPAEQYVSQWGLRPATAQKRHAEPSATPDPTRSTP